MDTIEVLADRLAIYLSAYKHYIEIKSKARLLNGTIFGESLCRDVAEIVFDYRDLVNLNLSEVDYPAIDLGSTSKGHAIQVTISGGSKKIESTLETFLEHKLEEKYSKLIFVILGKKQVSYESRSIIRSKGDFSFDPNADIYDLGDLFDILVKTSNPEKFMALNNRLEKELGSQIRPYLLGYDRPGQNLRALFEAHDVTVTNAVDALRVFGVSRKIYSDSASLSETATQELIQYVAQQFAVSGDWIEGESHHIYCNGPDIEKFSDWRRNLYGAFCFIERMFSNGEHVTLIIPDGVSLGDLDLTEDVVDCREKGFERFFLVSYQENDFLTNCYKMIITEPLSYRPTREGIFLLFLAAELLEFMTGKIIYIDVLVAERAGLFSCGAGEVFLVDLMRDGNVIGNHKDYIYRYGNVLHATTWLPSGSVKKLSTELNDFINRENFNLWGLKGSSQGQLRLRDLVFAPVAGEKGQ